MYTIFEILFIFEFSFFFGFVLLDDQVPLLHQLLIMLIKPINHRILQPKNMWQHHHLLFRGFKEFFSAFFKIFYGPFQHALICAFSEVFADDIVNTQRQILQQKLPKLLSFIFTMEQPFVELFEGAGHV